MSPVIDENAVSRKFNWISLRPVRDRQAVITSKHAWRTDRKRLEGIRFSQLNTRIDSEAHVEAPKRNPNRPRDESRRKAQCIGVATTTIVILVYVRRGLRIGVVLSLGFGDFSGMSAKALSDSAPIFFVYSV